MRRTVEAHTAEGRTNIKVLVAAPVLLLLMMSTADADGVKALLTTPQGFSVLAVAGVLIGTGVYFAAKITHSEI
jgi:tight adherence protein B